MPTFAQMLRRLRPLGVPGRARPAAVPADPRALLEAEVAAVFILLEPVAHRADQELAGARREAAAVRRRGLDQARAILAAADAEAARVQAEEAAARAAQLVDEASRVMEEGRRRAEAIDRAAASRLPALADELARRVLASWRP